MTSFETLKSLLTERILPRNCTFPLLEDLRASGRVTDLVAMLGSLFQPAEQTTVRRFMADLFAGEILEIADAVNDNEDGAGGERENVARSKLRIDTRKWLMAHFAPGHYSDKPAAANDTAASVPSANLYLPENGRP